MRYPTPGQAATTIVSMLYDGLRTTTPAAPLLGSQVRGAISRRAVVLAARRLDQRRAADRIRYVESLRVADADAVDRIGGRLSFWRWLAERRLGDWRTR